MSSTEPRPPVVRLRVAVRARNTSTGFEHAPARRNQRVVAVILGIVAMVTLALGGLQASRSLSSAPEAAEFAAAPTCPAAVECRQDVSAVVVRTYGSNGRSSSLHLVMRTSAGELDVRAPEGIPAQIAVPGQRVTVTYWRGEAVQVRDSAGHLMITDDDPAWLANTSAGRVLIWVVMSLTFVAFLTVIWLGQRRKRDRRRRGVTSFIVA
jgi:hypothetical protein